MHTCHMHLIDKETSKGGQNSFFRSADEGAFFPFSISTSKDDLACILLGAAPEA